MSQNNSNGGGVSFFGMLTILFIGLKLTGHINWSWLWVLSPCWGSILTVLGIVVLYVGVRLMLDLFQGWKSKKKVQNKKGTADIIFLCKIVIATVFCYLFFMINFSHKVINREPTTYTVALIDKEGYVITIERFEALKRCNQALNMVINDMIDDRDQKDKLIEAQKMRLLELK